MQPASKSEAAQANYGNPNAYLEIFFFRLAACYLKLKLRQGIGLLNPDPDISNTLYPTFVWLLWWVKIAQAELPEKSLAKPIWVKNSNIFLRQYVFRNDIELISLWSMFTGYGVEWADKNDTPDCHCSKFLSVKKLKVKRWLSSCKSRNKSLWLQFSYSVCINF